MRVYICGFHTTSRTRVFYYIQFEFKRFNQLSIAYKSISRYINVVSLNLVKNEETNVTGFVYRRLFRIGKGKLSKCGKFLEVRFEVELQTFSPKQGKLVTIIHLNICYRHLILKH